MNLSNQHLILVIILALATSCTSTSSTGSNEKSKEQLAEEKTIHDLEQLVADFPEPSLVPFTLRSIGARYNEMLINSLNVAESYKKNTDKVALNMGVYASDISYMAAYGKEDQCLKYLEMCHSLAEFLGDSAIYNKGDLNEFKGHILNQNKEEISKILSKLFIETSVQMERDHHLTMAGLALTGSFIEGLYHAVITIESFPNTSKNQKLLEPLVKIILDEEQALLDVIEVLRDLPFDDTIAEMITELSILDKLYKNDLKEVDEKMKNDPNYVVTKEAVRDITLEVKRIRKQIAG